MKKRVSDKTWFPFWVDKWIFGSMRIEFNLEERAIWIDLLALASKDDGYIRANEDIPYPLEQLAGTLIIPQDKLKKAIDKFIKKGKLIKLPNRTLNVAKWDKYQLSESYMRVQKHRKKGESNGKSLHSEKKALLYKDKIRKEHIILDNNIYAEEFSQFWNYYNYKVAKKDTLKAFKALRRKGETLDNIIEATKGYFNHLKNEKIHSNFEKAMMYPATFLRNEKYKDFIGVKYKLPM